MSITITTLQWVPPFAQGHVKDLRVRWALEEAGLSYKENLITLGEEQNTKEYRQKQPFGQVPVYEEDDLILFESGSIVLYIGRKSEALMPRSEDTRAQVTSWVFAALNSVEPLIHKVAEIDLFHKNEDWAIQRRPSAYKSLQERLQAVNDWLVNRSYLVDEHFTAADLIMTTILRDIPDQKVLKEFKVLYAYFQKNIERPAFKKAYNDQMKIFREYEKSN